MDSNPYAFNRDVSYPKCAGFPRNMTCKDLLEAHIQVVVPGKASGRGDFTADVEDIFSKYRLPHISSETVVGLWQTNPMGFWQNQVNFAVWCSTTGCGVSWRDHLDIDRPLARSVFRFHTYYQVRRILDELQVPLPQDQAWDPFQNPYDRRAYERLCREFGVDPSTDWRQKDSNSGGLGTVYQYNHGYQPQLRCSEAVPGKRWGCNIVPCGHTVGHRALSECAPECELKSGLRLRHWPLHGAERHATPYRHRHRRLQQPDHHRPGRAAPRGLPWHQQHPSASPRRDWRNGAGGTPNPRQASYGRDTQCRSSHPCSCCFATTNTKSAGSRGRKNGPCRRRSSARANDADTSVTYEALGVLGQPGRAGLQRLPPEHTRARRAIRRPSPRCWGARRRCSQWSPVAPQPPCQPVWPRHGQELGASFWPTHYRRSPGGR